MNILPKKRWHVRTKDNIARVRKDEAAAREEERKKQEKLEIAESEARLNFLRKRSGLPEKKANQHESKSLETNDKQDSTIVEASSSQHVNLFADYKAHIRTTNKELEKEKKDEQEKYEKKIGYLTYLGQDTNEALRLKSWYEVAPKRLPVGSERGELCEKDIKTKHNHDPLTLINALLPPEPKPIIKTSNIKRNATPEEADRESEFLKHSKKHKKEHKKHKKNKHKKDYKYEKHKKEKFKEKCSKDDELQKRLKLEQLRKERLRRETAERMRQEALLTPKEVSKSNDVTVPNTPRVVQKYNSQFNPELAKQNMI